MCTILCDDVFFMRNPFALAGVFFFRFRLLLFCFLSYGENKRFLCCTLLYMVFSAFLISKVLVYYIPPKKCILALFGYEMVLEILRKCYNYLPTRV